MANPFMAGMRPQDRRTHDRVAEDQQRVGDRSRKSGRERVVRWMRTGKRWSKQAARQARNDGQMAGRLECIVLSVNGERPHIHSGPFHRE
jgi:hypothetical protein